MAPSPKRQYLPAFTTRPQMPFGVDNFCGWRGFAAHGAGDKALFLFSEEPICALPHPLAALNAGAVGCACLPARQVQIGAPAFVVKPGIEFEPAIAYLALLVDYAISDGSGALSPFHRLSSGLSVLERPHRMPQPELGHSQSDACAGC